MTAFEAYEDSLYLNEMILSLAHMHIMSYMHFGRQLTTQSFIINKFMQPSYVYKY